MIKIITVLVFVFHLSIIHAQTTSGFLPDNTLKSNVELSTGILHETGGNYQFPALDNEIRKNKVLLIGENHWMSEINKIIIDLVLYANTKDYYPLLVLEKPYSNTAFINAYLEADSISSIQLMPKIKPLFSSKEGMMLLQTLKNWNASHSDKKIKVACSDIEQGLSYSLRNVFDPFFKACGQDSLIPMIVKAGTLSPEIQLYMDSVIRTAPTTTKVQAMNFLDHAYIKNVWENVKVTLKASAAMDKDGYDAFLKQRIDGIYRNLTDTNIFGNMLKNGKAILWVGASHAKLYSSDVSNKSLKMEGWLLANSFAPTKNKVFSIKVTNFAYTILPSYYNSESYKRGGEGPASLIENYKTEVPKYIKNHFRILDELTPLSTSLVVKSSKANNSTLILKRTDLISSAKKHTVLKTDAIWKQFISHDITIVVPQSTMFDYGD